jgi:hypothetical protein
MENSALYVVPLGQRQRDGGNKNKNAINPKTMFFIPASYLNKPPG